MPPVQFSRFVHRFPLVVLLGLLLPAAAQATDPVQQARAECGARKLQVRDLERRQASPAQIAQARKEWERACHQAQGLIVSGAQAAPAITPASAPATVSAGCTAEPESTGTVPAEPAAPAQPPA